MERIIAEAKRPAIVVAHPDDEALWCSGSVIRYPKNWMIVCCTVPHKDPERREKFNAVCDALGARKIWLGHQERAGLIPFDMLNLTLEDCDLIITHGPKGEYGHVQHKEVHQAMRDRYLDRLMWFAYNDTPNFTIEMTDDEWARKVDIIKLYDNINEKQVTWKRLLDYYGPRFPLRREPYALSTELLKRFDV